MVLRPQVPLSPDLHTQSLMGPGRQYGGLVSGDLSQLLTKKEDLTFLYDQSKNFHNFSLRSGTFFSHTIHFILFTCNLLIFSSLPVQQESIILLSFTKASIRNCGFWQTWPLPPDLRCPALRHVAGKWGLFNPLSGQS